MLRAIFDTARRLFGLVFEERADIPRYHADVRGFEALDEAGNHVGLLLLDFSFARQGLAPPWWMRLRLILTAVVLACLAVPILYE